MVGNNSDHYSAWSVFQMELNKPIIDDIIDRIKREDIEHNMTGLSYLTV